MRRHSLSTSSRPGTSRIENGDVVEAAAMERLAQPFCLSAEPGALGDAGPALATWDALAAHDYDTLDCVLDAVGAWVLGDSLLALALHMIARAGHHHPSQHPSQHRDGHMDGRREETRPSDRFQRRLLRTIPTEACPPDEAECPCSTTSAILWLSRMVPSDPARTALRHLGMQMTPGRRVPTRVSIDAVAPIDVALIVQACASIIGYRSHSNVAAVRASLHRHLIQQSAAALL